jgi:tRNA pseudouridine55 synthase
MSSPQAPAGLPAGRSVRRRVQPIDGVVVLDKPRGMSSNHAMLAVRRLLGAEKAGHGGTLDPMASGLLPVLLGEATKFANDALDADKTYLATLALGEVSSTADAEGEISATGLPLPDDQTIDDALTRFTGEISQIPPMYSALKQGGRPLYELARRGQTVERTPRRVRIDRLDLVERAGARLLLRVRCSKGTYIRVLAEDIGQAIGCGAWLADLRRESVGALSLETSATTLDALQSSQTDVARAHILPVDALLQSIPRLELADQQARRLLDGQRLRLSPDQADAVVGDTARLRIYGRYGDRVSGEPIFLGLACLQDGLLTPLRLISTRTRTAQDD